MKRIIAPPHVALVTGFVALLLSSPSASIAATYRFTKIAHTDDFLSNFCEAPAVNDSAMVVFLAEPTVEDVGSCLFIGDGGQLSTVTCERTLGGQLGAIPSINNEGTVALVLSRQGGGPEIQELMVGTSSFLRTLYSTEPALFFRFGAPTINDLGVVAFWAATRMESNPWSIFAGDGGDVTFIARSDVFWFTTFGALPFVNNTGLVAYLYSFHGPQPEEAIRVGDGEKATTVYSSRGGVFGSFGDPSLNQTGSVAFFATLVDGTTGIFAGDGGPVRTVVTAGDVFSEFTPLSSINRDGTVAFRANLTAGGSGIFTGPDPISDKVIASDDELFGSTVAEVGLSHQALNAAGQLVFFARLNDGTSGIFRADRSE